MESDHHIHARSASAPSAEQAIAQTGEFLNQMGTYRSTHLTPENQALDQALAEFDLFSAILYTPSAGEMDTFLRTHRTNGNNLVSMRMRDGTHRFIRCFTLHQGLTSTSPYTVVVNPVSLRSYIPSREIQRVSLLTDQQPLFHQLTPDLATHIYSFIAPEERAICTRTNPSTRSFFDEHQVPGALFKERLEQSNSQTNPMTYQDYVKCKKLGVMPSANRIRHLVLGKPMNEAELQAITEQFPHLKTLEFSMQSRFRPRLTALANLRNLQTLKLPFARDDDLAHLPQELQSLHIFHSTLSTRGFGFLAQLQLTHLGLGYSDIAPGDLIHLPTSLQALDLSSTHLSDADLVHLERLRKLRILSLLNNRLTGNESLHHLRQLPLQYLNLEQNPLQTLHLPPLPHLQILNVRAGNFPDAGLMNVALCPQLRYLNLSLCDQLTDAGLAHLRQLPLQGLKLTRCHQITDAGIAHLRGLPLQELQIVCCNGLTDASLAHVLTLPNLKKVWLPPHMERNIPSFHPIRSKFSTDFHFEWGPNLIVEY